MIAAAKKRKAGRPRNPIGGPPQSTDAKVWRLLLRLLRRTVRDDRMDPDAFYTTRGITKAIGVGQGQIAEWIKQKRLTPILTGNGYGFWGRDVLAAVEATSAEKLAAIKRSR